ncbi:hypothetical protein BD413DRAFT_233082 [Trametes elegans]|nr:hypothetical protein BD413DRAFT_233082 [Trametes elegans]
MRRFQARFLAMNIARWSFNFWSGSSLSTRYNEARYRVSSAVHRIGCQHWEGASRRERARTRHVSQLADSSKEGDISRQRLAVGQRQRFPPRRHRVVRPELPHKPALPSALCSPTKHAIHGRTPVPIPPSGPSAAAIGSRAAHRCDFAPSPPPAAPPASRRACLRDRPDSRRKTLRKPIGKCRRRGSVLGWSGMRASTG